MIRSMINWQESYRVIQMDITIISDAYNELKAIKDTFIGLSKLKIEIDSQAKINQAVKDVGDVQGTLFQLREELFRMQTDNESLKKN